MLPSVHLPPFSLCRLVLIARPSSSLQTVTSNVRGEDIHQDMLTLPLSYFSFICICQGFKQHIPFGCGSFEFGEGAVTQSKGAVFKMFTQRLSLIIAFTCMYL